jgi:hypothetical protein
LRTFSERRLWVGGLLLLAVILGGCASAKFIPTSGLYPAKPENCDIEVFTSRVPDRPYEEIGVIEGEGSLGADSLQEVLPEMLKAACKAGGDALILISSDVSVNVGGGDDFIGSSQELHTLATVIVWTDEE